MAPASTPLVVFSGIFIRQQARRFISAKYQRQSLNHRDDSTNSSTINGSTSAGSSLSAAVAISVVMLLFVIFIITCFLGYAVIKTRKKLPNQSDQTLEERRQRIFSQMAAPIMRKTLDLNPITPTLAESFHDNQESSGLLESGMVSGHQHRETVSYNENEGQDHICSICLENILPQEMIRQMPYCSHIFHQNCCELWIWKSLKRRQYICPSLSIVCPICRADLESQLKYAVKRPNPVVLSTTRV